MPNNFFSDKSQGMNLQEFLKALQLASSELVKDTFKVFDFAKT
jgi:hypothetical protein